MQYAYSANWDNASSYWDPFMTLVIPEEQFTNNAIFCTPYNKSSSNEYNNNYLNLISIGDTSNSIKNMELLSSIYIDSTKLTEIDSFVTKRNIPGTNCFWSSIKLSKGSHSLNGKTMFGGSMYGFSSSDSYGWPAATAFKKMGVHDTLPPVCKVSSECGEFTVRVTELRDGSPNDNPRQIDSGVNDPPFISKDSNSTFNFIDSIFVDNLTYFEPPNHKFEFKVKVKDKYRDAQIKLYVTDYATNDTTFIIKYKADSLTIFPKQIDFKNQKVGTSSIELSAKVNSNSDSLIAIKSIKLTDGSVFTITDGNQLDANGEILLPARTSKTVKLKYTPIKEYTDTPNKMDLDTLVVETKCLKFTSQVKGKGISPKIYVEDIDFGNLFMGDLRCKKEYLGIGLMIKNDGSDTLNISGIDKNDAQLLPFKITPQNQINYKFPIIISPNTSIYLEDICVNSIDTGKYSNKVKFITNNAIGKDSSIWKVNIVSSKSGIDDLNLYSFKINSIIPNPISNQAALLTFTIDMQRQVEISIINSNGEIVDNLINKSFDSGVFNLNIPTIKLSYGVYFIKMKSNDKVITMKFIKE